MEFDRVKIERRILGKFISGDFYPYINHIRFPHYKNIDPSLKLEFNYPITALVGQNGSNKSSVIKALFGCPRGTSIGLLWFSTTVDPIDESGGTPRYIYGYRDRKNDDIKEVIQIRTRSEKHGPDYWETTKPQARDGMEAVPKSLGILRWPKIDKNLVYIDFRNEISAFDKCFYHGHIIASKNLSDKRDFIRSRSKYLKRSINENLKSLKIFKGKKEHLFRNEILEQPALSIISYILGKKYSKIQIVEHSLFGNNRGRTIILENADLNYSEAFAGSGEFAVVSLVSTILSAKEKSLILLDEPEVSLHPGAQIRLMEFIMKEVADKHHQVVLSTHSHHMIDLLRPDAIKNFIVCKETNKVRFENITLHIDAMHNLETSSNMKINFIVEDALAEEYLKFVLSEAGEAYFNNANIIVPNGGAANSTAHIIPNYAQTDRKDTYFLLDGDQEPIHDYSAVDPNELSNRELEKLIKDYLGIDKIPIFSDGNANGSNTDQKREALQKIANFCIGYIRYIPCLIPEEFIFKNTEKSNLPSSFSFVPKEKNDYKKVFIELTKIENNIKDYENVNSSSILSTQIRYLRQLDRSLFEEHIEWVKKTFSYIT